MSSVLSFYHPAPAPPTKFFDVLTGSYQDSIINAPNTVNMPIPYIVTNQVLDINTAQSSDVTLFVNSGNAPSNTVSYQAKVMGGTNLIISLGPNITTYLRILIQNIESLPSQYSGPLELYIKPVMTKIQTVAQAQGDSPLNDEAVWGVTTEPPVSDQYIGGGPSQNFFTVYVFRSPMTIRYTISGTDKYLTFTSQFSAN
jgi:hypothetical protein